MAAAQNTLPGFVQFSDSRGKQLTVFVSEIPKVTEPAKETQQVLK